MQNLFSPDWQQTIVPLQARLLDVLGGLSKTGLLIACFVDESGVLLSIMTDSDVRRALLRGASLEERAFPYSNSNPFVSSAEVSASQLRELALANNIYEIPLVDSNNKLSDFFILGRRERRLPIEDGTDKKPVSAALPNSMLIQAGGLGLRLRSVISDRPKPLAVVGTQPILSTVIKRAAQLGIKTFYVSVNYMAEQLEAHLKSEIYSGLKIKIIRETTRLGTAGCIGSIKNEIKEPLLVCNADVLTTAPLDRMLDFHHFEKVGATCAVRPYHVTVPFGVVDIQDNRISGFREKPETNYIINAGIYILNPEVCQLVAKDQVMDMPDLLHLAIQKNIAVAPFLLHEYWVDIGQPEGYAEANQKFDEHFGE